MNEETIYGYPAKELVLFARMCERMGITEAELHDYCAEAKNGFIAGMQDWRISQENMLRRVVEGFTSNVQVFNISAPRYINRDHAFTAAVDRVREDEERVVIDNGS